MCRAGSSRPGLVILTVAVTVPLAAGDKGSDELPGFANKMGWTWHVLPEEVNWSALSSDGIVLRLDELKDGALLLTMAYSSSSLSDIVEFQPVAFDAARRRVEFHPLSSASSDGVNLRAYRLGAAGLSRTDMRYLGVEKLTKQNQREVIAPAAFKKLRESGRQALAFPTIGERYDFELIGFDGQTIASKELAGKVILLDFWATWCGPCMAKLPDLKKTYRRLHERGLEIIGINHDDSKQIARKAIEEHQIPWVNAMAPDDREMWFAAIGTTSLPYMLLIDRQGKVQSVPTPDGLLEQIEQLVGSP